MPSCTARHGEHLLLDVCSVKMDTTSDRQFYGELAAPGQLLCRGSLQQMLQLAVVRSAAVCNSQ